MLIKISKLKLVWNKKTREALNVHFSNKLRFEQEHFGFWDHVCPKTLFSAEKKNVHHYLILHIEIILGTKFHFKTTIWNFETQFAENRYSVKNR